ncbi:MAG: ABC transporter substrate-binding protein [Sedimentibacter sp.]
MKIKNNIKIFTVTILLLLLMGCKVNTPNAVEEPNISSQTSITVEDYFGRTVTLPKAATRIACGYAYTGHVVTMLGRGEDIVAVVDGLKRDKVLTSIHPHIKDLPVPFSSVAINIEELLACDPDVVFIKSDTAMDEGTVEKLNKLSIPYIVIDFYSMEEQIKTISIIGKVLGEEEKAQKYIDYYLKVIEDTKKITLTIPDNEKITLYHSVNEAVRTDVKNSLSADWINIAGGINVSIEDDLKVSGEKTYATLEQIYLWDPQVIIANEAGVNEYILENEQWKTLRAVKEKKVYQMPVGISRWGHPGSLETPLAIQWTAKLLYPQYFEDLDMAEITKDYYMNFFDISLDDDQANEILNGKGMREIKN